MPRSAALCTAALLLAQLQLGFAAPSADISATAPAAPSAPASLAAVVERWAEAAGGWRALKEIHAAHARGERNEGGVSGSSEEWITRDKYAQALDQQADRSETVGDGQHAWWKDWNGKVLELQGRDAQDFATAAFLAALVYLGPSKDALAAAGARWEGADSSGAHQVIRMKPRGGLPLEVDLDAATGLPSRAVRKPYDEEIVTTFGDWRTQDGVRVPFTMTETASEGAPTQATIAALTLRELVPGSRFERPADGPRDYHFTAGKRVAGIPFNFENDHIMIECSVNGTKPLWFMFDTGAGTTIINATRLDEFGLQGFGATETSVGGNSTELEYTKVKSLAVGGVELTNQRHGVIDLSGLERVYGMPMGGILGYDFASRFVVEVDYQAKTIALDEPSAYRAPRHAEKVPFVLEKGHPHLRAEVVVPGAPPIPADFILDSGAAETANLTAPFVREHRLLELARRKPAGAPNTMAGSESQFFAQTSVRGRLSQVKLGKISLTEIPVNLQLGTKGAYASSSFSGTIGQGILKRFTTAYDYSRRELVLVPNADFETPFPPRRTFGATLLADGPGYTVFKISGVRKQSPAEAAGLQKGDIVAALDGRPAASLRLADVRRVLTDEGSQHDLEIRRGGGPPQHLQITVQLVSLEDD